jgi:GntR family transcriptional regulator / MocR family aminotransferase
MSATITLDRDAAGPLSQQIASRLRDAITVGTLAPGARLPSARSLAGQLGVARGTVDAAYAILAGEGTLEPRGGFQGALTLVAHVLVRPGDRA